MTPSPGDVIIWRGKGFLFEVLSRPLAWLDRRSGWDRTDWHMGYVIKVGPGDGLEPGEIVTSEAAARGLYAITYPDVTSLGDCTIYHWLDSVDPVKLEAFAARRNGRPYDVLAYLWTIPSVIMMVWFNRPFRIVDCADMCWENSSEMATAMGDPFQPEEEPVLITRIVKALKGRLP